MNLSERLKYIVVDYKGIEGCVIFPAYMMHRDIARCHSVMKKIVIKRAGFCRYHKSEEGGNWIAWGRSESLNMDSDAELDSRLLNRDYPNELS